MISINCLRIQKIKKIICIFSIIIGLGLMVFIPEGSAQISYYPPIPNNLFYYGYYGYSPIANPFFYTYQNRNAALVLGGGTPGIPTPGGGLSTLLLPTVTPTLTPTVATPTLGVTTALILGGGGGGGGIATALTLLNVIPTPTTPTVATPTIGTTTAILLGGGVNTTTLLLLGV